MNMSVFIKHIPSYWPTEGQPEQAYGPLDIQLLEQNRYHTDSHIVHRLFSLSKLKVSINYCNNIEMLLLLHGQLEYSYSTTK